MRLFYFLLWGCTSEQPEEVISKPAPVVEEVEPSGEAIEEEEMPNQPPQIVSFEFEQSEYTQGEELRVTYETFDPEGDAVREEVFWNINGRELIAEKGKVLRKRTLKRGDKVVVSLVARDSSSNESTEAQKTIETTIENSPPQWVRDPREIKELEGYLRGRNDKTTVYSLLGTIYEKNNFVFMPTPAYTNFYGRDDRVKKGEPFPQDIPNDLFGTFMEVDARNSRPKMLGIWMGPPSENLGMEQNKNIRKVEIFSKNHNSIYLLLLLLWLEK